MLVTVGKLLVIRTKSPFSDFADKAALERTKDKGLGTQTQRHSTCPAGKNTSWLSSFRTHLGELVGSVVPSAAVLAFLFTLLLMGTLRCLRGS
ncbi:PREDICTED: small integral membrane protein 9 [Chinchilla lanigera]|uniref:small integral membrane protein 9 n=1 Tax=Chinchilla lanigera TaxID=34839 RepID=UPI00038EE232|nr:PREDICTED: small integral membrane protein 9 [Chinchilla lanigera]